MIKGLLRKALKPILGKKKAAVVAQELDRRAVKEADKHTGGLASKVDRVI